MAVIGGGPAGLIAAETLAAAGVQVTVYDRMAGVGRKFLMAGRGGLNLTHSEDFSRFTSRYRDAAPFLHDALSAFPPAALRAWCEGLGEKTFTGSSGRVFPVSFKASPLLRAWLRRLDSLGVRLALQHEWRGWDAAGQLVFEDMQKTRHHAAPDATLLALGGASWPRLGGDGSWTAILAARGIAIAPLQPANCGFAVAWSDIFRARFPGQPVKPLALRFGEHHLQGEAMITENGIEGGAIYALSAVLRDEIARAGSAVLHLDLRPGLSAAALQEKLSAPRGGQSLSTHLRKTVGLSPVAIGLLQDIRHAANRPFATPQEITALIKDAPLRLTAPFPIARAISSAGGIKRDQLDERFMLRALPGIFAAGEMLDWEAPTGGYLLQACFSTGVAAAKGALGWLSVFDGA